MGTPKIDLDLKTQEIFNNKFRNLKRVNWKAWLDISSKEEYEDIVLSNLGLEADIFDQIPHKKTDPHTMAVSPFDYPISEQTAQNGSSILCHTSGTSGSEPKYFHITDELIEKIWAPGMQAIFDSSNLTKNSSAVIFVPTRLATDGFDGRNVRLYSSEFSQRLVLSMFDPKSYLIDFYKNSRDVEVLSSILEMEDVSVVSAPASTILKWADIHSLQGGMEKSYRNNKECKVSKLIDKLGVEKAAKEVQNNLSEKLKDSTFIFSFTSLNSQQWNKIKEFADARVNNLYVGSEIGPFASSLLTGRSMYIFPLTLPVIENGTVEPVSRTKHQFGNLLSSLSENWINVDTGDVVIIENNGSLPVIYEEILRNSFKIKVREEVRDFPGYRMFAGEHFKKGDVEILNTHRIVQFVEEMLQIKITEPLFFIYELEKLYIPADLSEEDCRRISSGLTKEDNFEKSRFFLRCPDLKVEGKTLEMVVNRNKLLEDVRAGRLPKGAIKKWQFYFLTLDP
ncbi:MAG: hypothetical protein R6U44_04950 [Archaeoglobaceae archaeon]